MIRRELLSLTRKTLPAAYKRHLALAPSSLICARLFSTTPLVKDTQNSLNSPSELARKLSAGVLLQVEKPNVKKVLVVGSGGLSIGQAGEFDYSGTFKHPTCKIKFVIFWFLQDHKLSRH